MTWKKFYDIHIVVSEILKNSIFFIRHHTSKGTHTRSRRGILTRVRFRTVRTLVSFYRSRSTVVTIANPCYIGHHAVKVRVLWKRVRYPRTEACLRVWPFLDYATRYRRGLCNRCINTYLQHLFWDMFVSLSVRWYRASQSSDAYSFKHRLCNATQYRISVDDKSINWNFNIIIMCLWKVKVKGKFVGTIIWFFFLV